MAHYYSQKQDSKPRPSLIRSLFYGREFLFHSSSGVFSKKSVDAGTSFLARNMSIRKGEKVLDIGCGIGILGIVAATLGASVILSDVNERAVALTRKNIKENKIASAFAVQGNLYESITDSDFDAILLNPPQSAGKAICFSLIEGALSHLKGGGTLQLVARPNKGGKTLAAKMEEVFGNVSILAKKSGYAVYASRKN